MNYLAFDMDATLGEFITIWRIMCIFRQKEFYLEDNQPLSNIDLNWDLGISYSAFIKLIVDAESNKTPLGIFRPGIFSLFKEIAKMKDSRKIAGVIMYTNNGSKPLVDFVRDVFTYVTESDVFDDVFYYHHKLRVKKNGKPNPNKTWFELKILLKSIGAPDTVSPKNVLFFDDQEHTSLISTLKKNYIHVTPYNYKPPLAKLINIYKQSLNQSELLSDKNKKKFLLYIKRCTQNKIVQNEHSHLNLLSATTSKYINNINNINLEFQNETKFGSNYMLKSIKRVVDENLKKLNKTLKQGYKTKPLTKFTYKRR